MSSAINRVIAALSLLSPCDKNLSYRILTKQKPFVYQLTKKSTRAGKAGPGFRSAFWQGRTRYDVDMNVFWAEGHEAEEGGGYGDIDFFDLAGAGVAVAEGTDGLVFRFAGHVGADGLLIDEQEGRPTGGDEDGEGLAIAGRGARDDLRLRRVAGR